MRRYSVGHHLFLKVHSSLFRITDNVRGQISEHIFAPNVHVCYCLCFLHFLNLTFALYIQESAALDLNRRRSTGGILKRQEEERIRRYRDNNQPKSNMPDPKFHEKKELFNRRDHVVSINNDLQNTGDITLALIGQ